MLFLCFSKTNWGGAQVHKNALQCVTLTATCMIHNLNTNRKTQMIEVILLNKNGQALTTPSINQTVKHVR